METGGNFEDYIRVLSCHLFGPHQTQVALSNHGLIMGRLGGEVVKKLDYQ